jgi:hypothetical protein
MILRGDNCKLQEGKRMVITRYGERKKEKKKRMEDNQRLMIAQLQNVTFHMKVYYFT